LKKARTIIACFKLKGSCISNKSVIKHKLKTTETYRLTDLIIRCTFVFVEKKGIKCFLHVQQVPESLKLANILSEFIYRVFAVRRVKHLRISNA